MDMNGKINEMSHFIVNCDLNVNFPIAFNIFFFFFRILKLPEDKWCILLHKRTLYEVFKQVQNNVWLRLVTPYTHIF